MTEPVFDVARMSGFDAIAGQERYDDIGAVESLYVDFAHVREAFHKRREVFLTETDATIVTSIEIAAPPSFVWNTIKDMGHSPEIFPTIVKTEVLTGAIEDAGSVHTCLHGDGMHLVHYRVAYDDSGYRATDRLTGVPVIGRMLQTWEAKPSETGTNFKFYYLPQPETPITDDEVMQAVEETVRNHAEADVQGLKAFCEAQYVTG